MLRKEETQSLWSMHVLRGNVSNLRARGRRCTAEQSRSVSCAKGCRRESETQHGNHVEECKHIPNRRRCEICGTHMQHTCAVQREGTRQRGRREARRKRVSKWVTRSTRSIVKVCCSCFFFLWLYLSLPLGITVVQRSDRLVLLTSLFKHS